MHFWLTRGSAVTIREQIESQVTLGILSGDLAPGERLPSTRELARRFRLHPNTISSAYRKLDREAWVEFRHGSGVYIRKNPPKQPLTPERSLDQLIANFFQSARGLGIPLPSVRSRLQQWMEIQPPNHFLLLELDEELRAIVASEMQRGLKMAVESCAPQDPRLPELLQGAVPVCLPNRVKELNKILPSGPELLALRVSSVPTSLAAYLPLPASILIGIASRSSDFLKLASTLLIAAGLDSDALVVRDARKPNWHKGLDQTAAVVCDSLTATILSQGCRAVPFPLLSEASLTELREYDRT